MNDLSSNALDATDRAAEYLAKEAKIPGNPATRILLGLVIGVGAAVLIRALQSEPNSRRRLAAMFHDLEDRVERATAPVLRRAGSLAAENIHSLADGAERRGKRLEKSLQYAGRRLHDFLS